jgi:hypothetical protein
MAAHATTLWFRQMAQGLIADPEQNLKIQTAMARF